MKNIILMAPLINYLIALIGQYYVLTTIVKKVKIIKKEIFTLWLILALMYIQS